MDRVITSKEKQKARNKRLGRFGLIALALAAGLWYLRISIQPSVERDRIRTAVVERGSLEATVRASGSVIPGFEQVISSPVDSTVKKVLVEPGSKVTKGQALLELDLRAMELEKGQMVERISLKRKEFQTQKLQRDKERIDLIARRRVQEVELAGHKVKSVRFKKLFESGLVSDEEVREADLAVERAAIELDRLKAAAENLTASQEAQKDSLVSEIRLLEQDLERQDQLIAQGEVRADRDGILVKIVDQEGVSVNRGQELARVADLSWFKVEAGLSAMLADKLQIGQTARLKVNGKMLEGRVEAIRPTIEEGAAKALISLVDAGNPGLKANMRVETFIVTDARDDVLKVTNGPFLNGAGSQDIFVLRGDTAEKLPIVAGISNFEQVEIVNGLGPGDEIIISDMKKYLHLDKLAIQ